MTEVDVTAMPEGFEPDEDTLEWMALVKGLRAEVQRLKADLKDEKEAAYWNEESRQAWKRGALEAQADLAELRGRTSQ